MAPFEVLRAPYRAATLVVLNTVQAMRPRRVLSRYSA
jgi:hypothetical protein